MTRSWATIGYTLLESANVSDLRREHLELLTHEIKNAIDQIPPEDGLHHDWIVDDVADYIEESLGIGFVISQSAITSIISRAEGIPENFRTPQAKQLMTAPSSFRRVLLGLGKKDFGESGYSVVSCINAFANFYKHRSEWSDNWDKENLTRLQLETAEVVTALVGNSARSSGAFRAAARNLGCGESYDLQFLIDHLVSWHRDVMRLFVKV